MTLTNENKAIQKVDFDSNNVYHLKLIETLIRQGWDLLHIGHLDPKNKDCDKTVTLIKDLLV